MSYVFNQMIGLVLMYDIKIKTMERKRDWNILMGIGDIAYIERIHVLLAA